MATAPKAGIRTYTIGKGKNKRTIKVRIVRVKKPVAKTEGKQ